MKRNGHSLFVFVLLLIALMISIMLNSYLFVRGRQYYLQLNETRLDPLGLNYYTTNTDQQIFTKSVVFLGDSRAAYWPSPSGLPQFDFINRGIGAQTSAQVLQRFDYHVKPLKPQIVIVQICINDLKTIPLFPEQKRDIIANCEANIQQIVKKSRDIDAVVILTTIFPIGRLPLERKLFWSPDVALAINEVNSYIHTLKAQNVIIFDAYSILVDNGLTQDNYAQDFLHLNTTGYDALNDELIHILENLE
jgi:lysophospholipase L1-like esterase